MGRERTSGPKGQLPNLQRSPKQRRLRGGVQASSLYFYLKEPPVSGCLFEVGPQQSDLSHMLALRKRENPTVRAYAISTPIPSFIAYDLKCFSTFTTKDITSMS